MTDGHGTAFDELWCELTDNEHGGISRRCRDDNLLGSTLQVSSSLLLGGEDTGRLDDVLGAGAAPLDGGRVTLIEDSDLTTVDDELAVLGADLTLEAAVSGIVFEHVDLRFFRGKISCWTFSLSICSRIDLPCTQGR